MAAPDHILSWTSAVRHGLISGDPAYYYERDGYQADVDHALIVSIQEAHGIDWRVDGGDIVVPPPVDPPTNGWGDGVLFGARPIESQTIHLQGETGVVIDGGFFDGTIDSEFTYMPGRGHNDHVCILLENCTDITVRNVDFRQVSEPVAVIGGSNITVEYTRTDGITGPGARVNEQTGNFIQTVNSPTGIRILNNKIIGGDTEDIISLFSASDCEVGHNQIDGTGWTSGSGTGIIAGDAMGNNHSIHHNTLLNPGQVGLACAGGFGHRFEDNIVYSDHANENTAAYFWGYSGNAIGDGQFNRNRAKFVRGGGFWNPGGATQVGNNWDDNSIDPADLAVVL